MPSKPAIGGYTKLLDCPHAVFVLEVTPEGRFRVVAFNKEEEHLVGLSNEDAAGKYVDDLLPADVAAALIANYRRCVEAVEPISYDEEIMVPAGKRHCATTLVPVADESGRIFRIIGIARDVTREKIAFGERAEERLAQSQKFEALGRLAGGVAHDFNNILSVILSYSHLVLDDLAPGTLRSDLEVVCQAAGRAAELTRQLLAFSHQQVHRPRIMDLGQSVAGMKKMLTKILGENIALLLPVPSPGCRILADSGQIERVVLNLAMNGRDAMSQQGTLTIAVTRVAVESGCDGSVDVEPGEYVVLRVADDGIGMSAETRRRIFEPFFTTKGKGKGTGLGLSTVFGIVEQTGGIIRVDSELGRGSVFRVFFPAVAGAPSIGVSAPPPAGAAGGTETILLVEDDPQVLAAGCAILRRSGYSVLEANNAGEALLIAEQHEGVIDLLLTDIVMPRMTGAQLALRLAPLRPQMKAIYLSGSAGEPSRSLAPGADVIVVEKPFTPGALTQRVREVLG
jgi:two-component system cell cycle sensor histidine kinase/response regulator CckA